MKTVNEDDWRKYRELLPLWQERYMTKLINGYITLLRDSSNASDKFWALKRRINRDSMSEGVIVQVSRSSMRNTILTMLLKDIITLDDIKDFSDELRVDLEAVKKAQIAERSGKRKK